MKNKKLKASLSIIGYFFLTLALCFVGAFVFHSFYYDLIYVSGASMAPTLNGSDDEQDGTLVDFGIVDGHQSAINHIKRFDIISTYYPNSSAYNKDYKADGSLRKTATKKIKRVIAMPKETFIIKDGLLSIKDNNNEFKRVAYKNFKVVATTAKDTAEPITLGENEYWVLGDNRTNSTDCGTLGAPITKKNITGVLVAIEGKAELKLKRCVCAQCGTTYRSGNICSQCGGSLIPEYSLKNKQYHWPKFF